MTRIQLSDLGALQEIGSGGQGRVYSYAGDPTKVVKLYEPGVRPSVDVAALERLVAAGVPEVLQYAAWPEALVENEGVCVGFVMRRVPDEYRLLLRMPDGSHTPVLGQVQHLLNDDAFLAQRFIPVHDRWRLEFLRDTARALEALHRNDIAVGDLSPLNLLASLGAQPRCMFLDCDAMSVGWADRSDRADRAGSADARATGSANSTGNGTGSATGPATDAATDSATDSGTVLPQVETPGWEVPGPEPRGTKDTDAYKFGLLAVRLFAGDQDSRDPAALARVSPELYRLAHAALGPHPADRPAPPEWVAALASVMPFASTDLPWERTPGATVAGQQFTNPVPPPAGAYAPYTGNAMFPGAGVPAPANRRAKRRGLLVFAGVAMMALLLLAGAGRLISWAGEVAANRTVDTGQPGQPGQSGQPGQQPGQRPDGGQTIPSRNSGYDPPAGRGAEQAKGVQRILDAARADRARLVQAVQQVSNCGDVYGAISALQQVGTGRANERDDARSLDASDLDSGAALTDALAEAMDHSYLADQAYLRWAQTVSAAGCTGSALHGPARAAGDDESKAAQAAKIRFCDMWAPTARRYGYPVITSADL